MMIIGVPKEIKKNEYRVSITPAGVHALCSAGSQVLVQTTAGEGSGFSDEEYKGAGAKIVSVEEVFSQADMIVKVKEYLPDEYQFLRKEQIVFTYLHLAAEQPLTEAMLASETTSIAYETVVGKNGALPLLAPMSEVAGRMSVQIGAYLLQKPNGGSGVLLGGVTGVMPGEVAVIGGGMVGLNAAKMAMGLGARVTVFDVDTQRMSYIDDISGGRIHTMYSNPYNVATALKTADLVIGAVLIPGAKAPKVVSEQMVCGMRKGSVIVDVAIDQGGCVETMDHKTSYDQPSFEKYGVIHCSVPNIPGAVPRTSTIALSNATIAYVIKLAKMGISALQSDPGFMKGLNTYKGKITCRGVAEALDLPYTPPEELIEI